MTTSPTNTAPPTDALPDTLVIDPGGTRLLASRSVFGFVLTLLCTLAVTSLFWWQAKQHAANALRLELANQSVDISKHIERYLNAKTLVLKGFEGLFSASDQVTRRDFHDYYQTLNADGHISGVVNLSFHELVAAKDVDRFLANVRQEGFTDYRIHPLGTTARVQYAPLRYVEPLTEANRLLLGFDPLTVAVEQAAVHQAQDSGRITISGKLLLKQDSGAALPSVVMYLPLFRRSETMQSTAAERRARFIGWVDMPFRLVELLAQALPDGPGDIDFDIYDAAAPSADSLLYSSRVGATAAQLAATPPQEEQRIYFGGRVWTLVFQARAVFGAATIKQKPLWVAATGGLLSLLAGLSVLLMLRLQNRRIRSVLQRQALAEHEMRHAQQVQSRRLLQDSLWAMNEAQRIGRVGTYVTDIQTGIWEGSAVLDDIFGIDASFKKTIPSWNDLVAPEFRAELLASYEQVARGDGSFRHDYQVIRPADGQRRWVAALGEFSRDAAGAPQFLRGTIQDITPRKEAELGLQHYRDHLEDLVQQKTADLQQLVDALAESEQRWSFALEASGDGVWDWNMVNGKAVLSRRWKQMLGYAEHEIGNDASEWSSRVHPDDMPNVMANIQAHIDGQTEFSEVEFRMRCKDQSWLWVPCG